MRLPEKLTGLCTIFAMVILAISLLAPVQAGAQAFLGGDFDDSEIKLLPPYCRCAQTFRGRAGSCNDPAEYARWSSQFGEVLTHIHHWCWGLIGLNRAKYGKSDQLFRNRMCNAMIGEANYVIARAPRNFVLNPEFLTMRGNCRLQLRNLREGFLDLQAAMDLRPDYWPPYIVLSDFYKDLGETAKARQVLEQALTHSPDSKTVKSRLAALGAAKDTRTGDSGAIPKPSAPPRNKAAPPETKEPETASER